MCVIKDAGRWKKLTEVGNLSKQLEEWSSSWIILVFQEKRVDM